MLEAVIAEAERLGLALLRVATMDEGGLRAACPTPSTACHNSYSVGKAFVTAALGLLYDRGLLDVREPFARTFGQWADVAIEEAMVHRIGFAEGFLDIDTEDIWRYGSDDFLALVFAHPRPYAPGTHYQYTDAAFYLLSRLVEAKAGRGLDDFLWENLLAPLRFQEVAWSRDPQGHPIGATGLYIRAMDMVKLGYLYAMGGVWEGRRLLSREWVELVLARGYEFHPIGERGWYGKGGMNGQMLMFQPDKKRAVAWHAYAEDDRPGRLAQFMGRL